MTRPGLEIALGDWATLSPECAPIRVQVFVIEQRVPEDMEWDDFDAVSVHALARMDGEPVGTARLLPDGHIGRMAVLAHVRGQGVGTALLLALIETARQRGLDQLVLHAQCHAMRFYERFGFRAEGDVFDEAGIDHVKMVLRPGF